jgi:hypothetical protein
MLRGFTTDNGKDFIEKKKLSLVLVFSDPDINTDLPDIHEILAEFNPAYYLNEDIPEDEVVIPKL